MNKDIKSLKVAIITDHIFTKGGAISVTKEIGTIFNNPHYYFLFGDRSLASEYLGSENIFFTGLNKKPFLRKLYKYTYFLWPLFIESLDLSSYDLVISSSFSVAHGAITSQKSKHISYIHTPMRYAWDLREMYFNRKSFGFLRMIPISILTSYLRMWDVYASSRSDLLIANSKFVSKRISKYWDRKSVVIYPPVELYGGLVVSAKDDYFVTGAPFEVNKNGEFIMDMVIKNNLKLKVIGSSKDIKRWKRKYRKYPNIEFLGYVSNKEKFKIFSNAKGYLACGIEDFGIFPVECISCGTPVLAYKAGGYMDYIKENVNGIFFSNLSSESFKKGLDLFLKKDWNYLSVNKSVKGLNKERFINEIKAIVLKNIQ
jgi:glycosyltransferase involved in cell wall biosynthesis